jgi:hypothetical protein
MFNWYQHCEVCFAYLCDVTLSSNSIEFQDQFHRSRWFTRSWCLQELIAPRNVYFFNIHWERIGSKSSLSHLIGRVTGIDKNDLLLPQLPSISVARKMKWASRRQCTRIEDIAYSLLGIFDVNMPLLYGEGEKAFIRLQEEILRQTDDHSIFAWGLSDYSRDGNTIFRYVGFLARHPSAFRYAGDVDRNFRTTGAPCSVTSRGIRISLPIARISNSSFKDHHQVQGIAILNCHRANDPSVSLGVKLWLSHEGGDVFVRSSDFDISVVSVPPDVELTAETKAIYLLKTDITSYEQNGVAQCWLRSIDLGSYTSRFELQAAAPSMLWDLNRRLMISMPWWSADWAALAFLSTDSSGSGFCILIQFDLPKSEGYIRILALRETYEHNLEMTLWNLHQTVEFSSSKDVCKKMADLPTISGDIETMSIKGQPTFFIDVKALEDV